MRFLLLLMIAFAMFVPRTSASEMPNIVLLYADDAGYADFGFNGSPHFRTPHLDQLASEGTRLTQFYMSASVCGPSRAGLLTGKYQQRFGFEENNVPGLMSPAGAVGEDMGLPLNEHTIGDHMQRLGYKTAIFGKWHMGYADRFHPTKRGFDEFYGFRGGARSYFAYSDSQKQKLTRGHWMEDGFGKFEEHQGYLTDVLADKTCEFIRRNSEKPFFAFVSFNAVHGPMHPDPKDADEFPALDGKRRKLAQMALSMDRACGKIINELKQLGLYENTLIIFTNDNGGPTFANSSSNYPFSGTKATHREGGIRVPCIMTWPGKIPKNTVYEYPAIALDLLPTFYAVGGGDIQDLDGIDGVDLLPFMINKNKSDRPHTTLYWKKEIRGTIRHMDWKLLRYPDRPAELYDLSEDPGEQINLAGEHPELVAELYKKLFAWELRLDRPIFQLRRQEEVLWTDLHDTFSKPQVKDF
ncbi:MAG: sulfatase-like hydrolase/transferase [Puniceicoccaceae bacterium]